jgi:hypothetical protein
MINRAAPPGANNTSSFTHIDTYWAFCRVGFISLAGLIPLTHAIRSPQVLIAAINILPVMQYIDINAIS